jgi:predicted nucleotidyltransferase
LGKEARLLPALSGGLSGIPAPAGRPGASPCGAWRMKKDLYKGKKCTITKRMKNHNYIDQLLEALKQSDPYRIILFGSYAKGTANEHSDIDMVVILDNNDVAKNYEERLQKKLYINRLIRNINYKVALDILVYSKAEYKIVKECGNYFIDEIEKTGKIIYEKAG